MPILAAMHACIPTSLNHSRRTAWRTHLLCLAGQRAQLSCLKHPSAQAVRFAGNDADSSGGRVGFMSVDVRESISPRQPQRPMFSQLPRLAFWNVVMLLQGKTRGTVVVVGGTSSKFSRCSLQGTKRRIERAENRRRVSGYEPFYHVLLERSTPGWQVRLPCLYFTRKYGGTESRTGPQRPRIHLPLSEFGHNPGWTPNFGGNPNGPGLDLDTWIQWWTTFVYHFAFGMTSFKNINDLLGVERRGYAFLCDLDTCQRPGLLADALLSVGAVVVVPEFGEDYFPDDFDIRHCWRVIANDMPSISSPHQPPRQSLSTLLLPVRVAKKIAYNGLDVAPINLLRYLLMHRRTCLLEESESQNHVGFVLRVEVPGRK
ncbi:hypothetical protein IWX90DRAFT_508047 [Phyllosticta citrichinensis]|uniref:Uncharacterized protein n=1 Tax=Phyllosticta citrichinensis TaxID=1130410 RepID=A0ABR1XL56_9PEZI